MHFAPDPLGSDRARCESDKEPVRLLKARRYLPLPLGSGLNAIRRVPRLDAMRAERRDDLALYAFVIQRGVADKDERHVGST